MLQARAVFISDTHLGTKGCKSDLLLEFLNNIECDYLFLVGDIIDLWGLKSRWNWSHKHTQILQRIIDISSNCRVVYIPGNHDEDFRNYLNLSFNEIKLLGHCTHTSKNGQRFIVMHGDQFDHIIIKYKWLAMFGSVAYEYLIMVNGLFNSIRKILGYDYWSLSGYLKHKAKKQLMIIENFEKALSDKAKKTKHDGVICGHIHKAEILNLDGITYINCGDWVESCTAVLEDHDGNFKLINWSSERLEYINSI